MKCHEYLKGSAAPCSYCLAEKLEDQPLSQEVDFNGRRYYSRVTRIDWNGRDAYINYIADRTGAAGGAETAAPRAEDKPAIGEHDYLLAAEQCGVSIFIYETSGRVGRFNKTACRDFGMPALIKDLPQYALDKGLIDKQSVAEWQQFFADIDGGKPYGETDIHFNMPNGLSLWLKMRFAATAGGSGEAACAAVSFTDITGEIEKLLSAQRQADRDGMTELYNHTAMERIVSQFLSCKDAVPSALILLDVDDLKYVNDNYGHLQGDRVLISVAGILKKHFRSTDIIGRIGGDEFAALLPGVAAEKVLEPALRSVLAELSRVRAGEHRDYAVHGSIGCTLCRGGIDDFVSAYKRADAALYHVKRGSKNSFVFYSEDMCGIPSQGGEVSEADDAEAQK